MAWSGEGAQRLPRTSMQLRAISLEYPYQELAAATQNFSKSARLGSGNYGAVYKGEMPDGSEVAIKAIDLIALRNAGQSGEAAGFEDEVQTLSKFRHPNLVTLIGWGKQRMHNGEITCCYLVYELLGGGDAFQRLSKSKNGQQPFPWCDRLSVLLDAAQGLSHMHNSKPKGFHRDIKSANILLDRHGTAKMADFGLSCNTGHAGGNSVKVNTISGTPGYACPFYTRTGYVTEGSEVYSFGMVMLEILCTMAPAIADPRKPGGIRYPIAENIGPNRPDGIQKAVAQADPDAGWPRPLAEELARLAIRAVNDRDENLRPKFVEIVRSLRKMTETYPAPEKGTIGSVPASFASGVPQVPAHLAPGVVVQQAAAQLAAAQAATQMGGQQSAAGYPGAAGAHAVQNSSQQPTPLSQMPLNLVLMSAAGVDVDALPHANRKLALMPVPPSGESAPGVKLTAYIGRQHQPELFEAWLPDLSLRNCISRTAFEVTLGPARGGDSDALWVYVRGANPMTVDGRPAARSQAAPVQLGSEVGFSYSTDERSTFLLLRLQPAVAALPSAGPPIKGSAAVDAAAAASSPAPPQGPSAAPKAVPVQVSSAPPSKASAPRKNSGSEMRPIGGSDASSVGAQVRSTTPTAPAASDRSAASAASNSSAPQSWRLVCVKAEGLSPESIASMPMEFKSFSIQGTGAVLGRQHQPQVFEALLSGAPSRMSYISRTHVQMEVKQGTLYATNMSSNPIYVGRKGLDKGGSCALAKDDVLSFARNEGNSHVNFIALRVYVPGESAEVASAGSVPSSTPSTQRADVRRSTAGVSSLSSAMREDGTESASGFVQSTIWSVHESRAIKGGVNDLFVGTMTPEEAKTKAASLPECQGFCYEGPPTGGPFTIFFKAKWEVGTAPGWTAYRYHREREEPGPPPQRTPAMPTPKETPTPQSPPAQVPSSPSRNPGPSTDSPPKRKPRPADSPPRGNAAADLPEPEAAFGETGQYRAEKFDRMAKAETPSLSSGMGGPGFRSNADREPTAETKVVLVLSGDGVLDVPVADRRIGPVALNIEPIVVGRRHQPDLHRRAVAKDCLQFLSRDHFQISFVGRGYQLRALTSNPIWRARDGQEPVELKAQEDVSLVFGDRIALGTGDRVTTPTDALRTLCWRFKRDDEDAVGGGDSSWEPMLPSPAAAASDFRRGQGNNFRDERPSEFLAPEPRQLPGGQDRNSGVMRPPVGNFDDWD